MVLFLLFFIFILNTGVFYFNYQEPRSNIAAAQPAASGTVNNTNTTNNSFNETSSTFAVNDITPSQTITLTPTQNISETAELRIPEIEVRQKFMEVEKREEALEEINPSLEENIQEQQVDLGSNETTSSTVMPPTSESDSDSNHQLNSSFRGSNEEGAPLPNTNTTTLASLILPAGFRIYHDSDLSGTVPPDAQFFRNEPVVAKAENTVFYVGTFYAANSSDGGRTWSYIDLLTQMPITCCDSDLTYDDRNGVFLWSMMNFPYRGSSPELGEINNITLGVSADTALWRLYDISAEMLNAGWTNNVLDYPQLFMTEKYVYISANRFTNWSSIDPRGNIFEGPVMMRIERDLLNAGASIPFEFMYSSPPAEVFTGVQGSDDIFHWATHLTNTTNSTMRLYTWQDNSSSIRSIDRIIDNYNASNKFYCGSPDNFNWCQTSDHRITGGWKMGDIIGFLWNVPAGGDFPYTYVDAATFNSSDMTYLTRPSLWSEDHAWAYAFASPDKDKLGIVAAFGGGNVSKLYPGSAVGIGIPASDGYVVWNLYYAVNGTNGPVNNTWGDYFRTFAMDKNDNENRWVGTGFVLQDGNSSRFIKPHYFEFGLDNSGTVQ